MDDTAAIVAVTHAYCWALDSHAWDDLDQVFTPDASAELGGEFAGLDAIKERVSSVLTLLRASQHMVATHQVVVDGDRATCRCYLHAQHVRDLDGLEAQFIVGGRYDDELLRTAAGWRIARRALTVIWTAGDPAVLQP
jgi:hypothetical protein